MLVFYPLFLAEALKTNLTRVFTGKRMRFGVAIAAVVLSIIPFVFFVLWDSPLGAVLLYSAVTLLFIYALVASIHAWRIAPVGLARDRARVFAIAFGIRDACWVFSYATSAWMMYSNSGDMEPGGIGQLSKLVYALGTLLAVPLIAYGILRAHLFDIDLRIRWTIKQSTLAGFIVAIIFLISEGASEFLSAELGSVAGLLAAAVVIFFLAPLQRFAERVASSAMPNTENTPEYVAYRKMQVYEAALSDVLDEGGISPKERALLKTLHESLGISATDAEAIENDVKTRLAENGLQLATAG
ncbi:hypothetical protein BH24PSE2_BH24PSE2_08000 [soil metagenome]